MEKDFVTEFIVGEENGNSGVKDNLSVLAMNESNLIKVSSSNEGKNSIGVSNVMRKPPQAKKKILYCDKEN